MSQESVWADSSTLWPNASLEAAVCPAMRGNEIVLSTVVMRATAVVAANPTRWRRTIQRRMFCYFVP